MFFGESQLIIQTEGDKGLLVLSKGLKTSRECIETRVHCAEFISYVHFQLVPLFRFYTGTTEEQHGTRRGEKKNHFSTHEFPLTIFSNLSRVNEEVKP